MCARHLRSVKVRRTEYLSVAGCVCVERVAVVQRERLPGFLVFSEVPAGSELRLQSLDGGKNTKREEGRVSGERPSG